MQGFIFLNRDLGELAFSDMVVGYSVSLT